MKNKWYVTIGTILLFGGLWGGYWFCSVVGEKDWRYQPAILTAIVLCGVGTMMTLKPVIERIE